MRIQIEDCSSIKLPLLHKAMCGAFADYVIPMSPSFDQFRFMLAQRGFDPDLSRIAVVDGRIAAFWLIGRHAQALPQSAYVITTGTLPGFRAKGLSRRIFAQVQQGLVRRGKSELRLEVIENNKPAARLYKSLGFQKARKLISYTLPGHKHPGAAKPPFTLRNCRLSSIRSQIQDMPDWQPSWQNSFDSLERIEKETLTIAAFEEETCLGYGVFLPPLATIAQLAVRKSCRRKAIGTEILSALAEGREGLKVLNLDERDQASLSFFKSRGAKGEVVQKEMTYDLTA